MFFQHETSVTGPTTVKETEHAEMLVDGFKNEDDDFTAYWVVVYY